MTDKTCSTKRYDERGRRLSGCLDSQVGDRAAALLLQATTDPAGEPDAVAYTKGLRAALTGEQHWVDALWSDMAERQT